MKVLYDKNKQIFTITEATKIEYHQVKKHLTRYPKNYQYDPRFKMRIWDGKICLLSETGTFKFGLWKEVYDLCKLNNWQFFIENKEDFPNNKSIKLDDVKDFCKEFFKSHKTKDGKVFFPYDHQIETTYKILRNKFC